MSVVKNGGGSGVLEAVATATSYGSLSSWDNGSKRIRRNALNDDNSNNHNDNDETSDRFYHLDNHLVDNRTLRYQWDSINRWDSCR